jgi:hypothetical protein
MDNQCPACQAFAIQRPVNFNELSQLSSRARAEIVLLQQTALACEACGCVYVIGRTGTVCVDRLPVAGRS